MTMMKVSVETVSSGSPYRQMTRRVPTVVGEHDGGTDPEIGQPYGIPNIWNATYIGRGEADGKRMISMRDNAGGHYHNSIFCRAGTKVFDIEILGPSGASENSYDRFQAGDLSYNDNVFWNIAGNDANDIFRITAAKYDAGMDTTTQAYMDSVMEVEAAATAWGAHFAAGKQHSC